jgi:hypothetical protein
MPNSETPEEFVNIDIDMYDGAFADWCIRTFGKATDDAKAIERFDKTIGLEYDNSSEINYNVYTFKIVDKKKYMLFRIRYGF